MDRERTLSARPDYRRHRLRQATSGFHPILLQLTQSVPNRGGLVLGVKGDEHAFVQEALRMINRHHAVVVLKVGPNSTHRYNLLSDRSLPWTTHAKAIVDTAASLTEGRQDAFFRPMAQIALSQSRSHAPIICSLHGHTWKKPLAI